MTFDGEPGSCWHLSTREALSIRDLVKKICEIADFPFNKIVNDVEERLGKDKNYFLNSDNIRNIHNWHDSIKLEDGIKQTIEWVDKNMGEFIKLPWEYIHKK